MEEKELKAKFSREDDFVDKGSDYSDAIVKTYVHKKVVVKTGDGEDDFILVEKPVLVDEYDIHKSINEEAKTTDLKYLLKQVLQTGDESILNVKSGFYGDVTKFPSDSIEAHNLLTKEAELRSQLPEPLKDLTTEELVNLTKEDIIQKFSEYVETHKQASSDEQIEEKEVK